MGLAGRGCPAEWEPLSCFPGTLSNPGFFNYGVEAHKAYKKQSLSSDIIEEQKKLQEADLVIFQVGFPFRCCTGSVCRLCPETLLATVYSPQRGFPSPSGNGLLPVFVSFPCHWTRCWGFCGDHSGSRETSLLQCGVRLSSSEPLGPTPRRHVSPQAERGQAPSRTLPLAPWLGSWFCCPRAGSVRGPQSRRQGDPEPPAAATKTLSALPAQPAAAATLHTSEQGEELPTRVAPGGTCLPRPGRGRHPRSPRRTDTPAPPPAPPQFPLYWFSVPAVLKGWMDRVLCQGFAFDFPGSYDDGFLKV